MLLNNLSRAVCGIAIVVCMLTAANVSALAYTVSVQNDVDESYSVLIYFTDDTHQSVSLDPLSTTNLTVSKEVASFGVNGTVIHIGQTKQAQLTSGTDVEGSASSSGSGGSQSFVFQLENYNY